VELGGVKPNPRSGLIREGIELARKEGVDFLLPIGGGSVIDSAKAIALGVPYDGDFWDWYSGKGTVTVALPVGAIVTIAASGSEGSTDSVVTLETKDGTYKRCADGDILRPKFAIMNPELMMSLPPYQTASGITDIMRFTQNESCGKCVPCREGTKRMLEILDRILDNKGSLEDLDLLEELADTISHTALCGLGQSACKPVQSTLKYFRNEYLAHVVDHHCPICNREKPHPIIDAEKCKGCGKCRRNCPAEAITGETKQPHAIDGGKCINCGACVQNCPFGAITAAKEG
jgi:Uncharacterized oxidoreductases, Fe-dependent alcohol dehydrogenase family